MVVLTTKASSLLASCCLVLAIGVYFYHDDPNFDYFYLSLQWPQSFCNTGLIECFQELPDNFTIHGLWAQKTKKGSYTCNPLDPTYPFNYSQLVKHEELINRMNISWPNLVVNKTNKAFWRNEWKKHGSCTFESKQVEYFRKTCEMWERAPLLNFFKGITSGNWYLLKEYKEAIAKKLGLEKPARFICNNDTKGTEQLFEVRLCTDKEVTEFVECPENRKSLSHPHPHPHPHPSHPCSDSINISFPKVDAVAVM